MAHHEEADGVHAECAGRADVFGGDVGFGAVGGDPDHGGAGAMRVYEVVDGADSGQQQRRDPGASDHPRDGFDPFEIGVGAESVVAGRARQSVAVGDLDGVHTRGVERGGDGRRLFGAVLVPHRVHAVAQRDVADVEVVDHVVAPAVSLTWVAMRSAVALAAEVMMSRLPA